MKHIPKTLEKVNNVKYNKTLLSITDSLLVISATIAATTTCVGPLPLTLQLSDIGLRNATSHDSFDRYEGSTASRTIYRTGRFLREKLKFFGDPVLAPHV